MQREPKHLKMNCSCFPFFNIFISLKEEQSWKTFKYSLTDTKYLLALLIQALKCIGEVSVELWKIFIYRMWKIVKLPRIFWVQPWQQWPWNWDTFVVAMGSGARLSTAPSCVVESPGREGVTSRATGQVWEVASVH